MFPKSNFLSIETLQGFEQARIFIPETFLGDIDTAVLYPAPDNEIDRTSAEYQDNNLQTIEKNLGQAEFTVLSYYAPHPNDPLSGSNIPNVPIGGRFGVAILRPQLLGYRGTFEDPKINEMDEQLLFQIRLAIAGAYDNITNPDKTSGIESIQEGSQSISFDTSGINDDELSWTEYLDPYDARQSYTFL